jgi:hypothetical protein
MNVKVIIKLLNLVLSKPYKQESGMNGANPYTKYKIGEPNFSFLMFKDKKHEKFRFKLKFSYENTMLRYSIKLIIFFIDQKRKITNKNKNQPTS